MIRFDFRIHRLILFFVMLDFIMKIYGRFLRAHLAVVFAKLQYLLWSHHKLEHIDADAYKQCNSTYLLITFQ